MSEELRPCPFCGGKAITSTFLDWDDLEYMPIEVNDSESIDGEVTCENERCINGWWLSQKEWNTRPIEDALNARIAELEGLVDKLIEVGDELADDREYQDDLVDLWHDVTRGLKEREIPCKHCHGTGTVYLEGSIHGEDICPKCHGTGIKERER